MKADLYYIGNSDIVSDFHIEIRHSDEGKARLTFLRIANYPKKSK